MSNLLAISGVGVFFIVCFSILAVCGIAEIVWYVIYSRLYKASTELKEGMDKEAVKKIAGKPRRGTESFLSWEYKRYFIRRRSYLSVSFDNDNKVLAFNFYEERLEKYKEQKRRKQVVSVEVLGVRTGQETRILATYNFTVYSLLIRYDNGTQEVIECTSDSDRFQQLVPFIHNNNQSNNNNQTIY